MPATLRGLMGVPRDHDPTPAEAAVIGEVGESIFPVRPRRDGFIFDAFVGNLSVREVRLEDLAVPTLVIHAADDSLASYAHAEAAVARIPDVSFVTVDTGGHLFRGQQSRVRSEVTSFLAGTPAGQHRAPASDGHVPPTARN